MLSNDFIYPRGSPNSRVQMEGTHGIHIDSRNILYAQFVDIRKLTELNTKGASLVVEAEALWVRR